MMRRYFPPIVIFVVIMMTFKLENIAEISPQKLIDWKARRDKMRSYCDGHKALILKKNFLVAERTFQKKLVENIVHINNLRINWCLGKSGKIPK